MNTGRLNQVMLGAGLVILCIIITCCHTGKDDHPASSLQHRLASIVGNADTCPTGDSQDVQQMINTASTDGVAHLPQGCFRITTTINMPTCTRLVGAGADKTILYRDPESQYSQPILQLRSTQSEACATQISGIAFLGVRNSNDSGQDYGLKITSVRGFRLDHSYFEGFGFAAVRVEGDSSGVIDHAIFVDNFKQGIDNLGYGVVVYGAGQWKDDLQPGGAEAVFVENNLFVGNRHAIAASSGAYYVFRKNQVMHGVEACAIDAHGMGYGSAHGTQYVEIYRNTVIDPVYAECGIGTRGGAGVIFENMIQGYKNPILLILEWGTPDKYKAEYPALDQVHDLYIWDNQINFGSSEPEVDETGIGFIELNRDYFTQSKPGYVSYIYPHPLANGGPFDLTPWPPGEE